MNCSAWVSPSRNITPDSSANGQPGRNVAQASISKPLVMPFAVITVRNPWRRSRRLARKRIDRPPIGAVKVTSPLCAAVRPKPSCSIEGIRKGAAPTASRVIEPPSTDSRKVAIRISPKSRIGFSRRRACRA